MPTVLHILCTSWSHIIHAVEIHICSIGSVITFSGGGFNTLGHVVQSTVKPKWLKNKRTYWTLKSIFYEITQLTRDGQHRLVTLAYTVPVQTSDWYCNWEILQNYWSDLSQNERGWESAPQNSNKHTIINSRSLQTGWVCEGVLRF